jgi:hypothetical protein
MEVKSIASLATTMATTATQQAVSISVMKKAMDMQASSAAAMLEMLPPVDSANLPSHLGQHVNITA